MQRPATASRFATAVQHAEILLEFACSKGGDASIDQESIKAIVRARQEIAAGNAVDTDLEIKFWDSYRKLAKEVAPVTVESISATAAIRIPIGKNPGLLYRIFEKIVPTLTMSDLPYWSLAQRTVLLYRLVALFVLLFVIVVQVFWLNGVSITNDLRNLQSQMENLKAKQVKRFEVLTQLSTSEKSKPERDPVVSQITANLVDAVKIYNASMQSLRHWNRQWAGVGVVIGAPFMSEAFGDLEQLGREKIEITAATMFLQAVATYALPLLYGLLGACTYVLREMQREIGMVTFTKKSRIGYSLRLSLGLLAGIAVGFLILASDRPGTEVTSGFLTFEELSPLALAFVAGYSVELIFTAMDRIVSGTSK